MLIENNHSNCNLPDQIVISPLSHSIDKSQSKVPQVDRDWVDCCVSCTCIGSSDEPFCVHQIKHKTISENSGIYFIEKYVT